MTALHARETMTAVRSVSGEIAARIREMRASGSGILPPLLLLGTMERVGSNWVSDTLRPVTGQHNEPFRQQVDPAHPLSALNPSLSPGAPLERLGTYGRHWLVTFVASKHATERQVIKETNLFFALPALLGLFPDSPVVVLTRSPLGVASSFARGDLFRRWDYRARYRQITAMASRPEYTAFAPVVPDDDPGDLVVLARLQVLNTLLIANALWERGKCGKTEVIHYERSVLHPGAAHAALARLVQGAARALSAGREAVQGPAWDLARDWTVGDYLYSLAPPATRRLPGRNVFASRLSCPVRWVPGHSDGALQWRNLLVTNDEFAEFLNEMAAAGLPNSMDGCYVLAVEMPRERGGRLHYNRYARLWTASPGFGRHPAYWVTWAGAAVCAARHGARLPARAELLDETSRDALTVTNYDYQGPIHADPALSLTPSAGPDRCVPHARRGSAGSRWPHRPPAAAGRRADQARQTREYPAPPAERRQPRPGCSQRWRRRPPGEWSPCAASG